MEPVVFCYKGKLTDEFKIKAVYMYKSVSVHIPICYVFVRSANRGCEHPEGCGHFCSRCSRSWEASQEEVLPLPALSVSDDRTRECGGRVSLLSQVDPVKNFEQLVPEIRWLVNSKPLPCLH